MALTTLNDGDTGLTVRNAINSNFTELYNFHNYKIVAACEFMRGYANSWKTGTTTLYGVGSQLKNVDTYNISSVVYLGSSYGPSNNSGGYKLTFLKPLQNRYIVLCGDYHNYNVLDSGNASFGDTTDLPLDHVIVSNNDNFYNQHRNRYLILSKYE